VVVLLRCCLETAQFAKQKDRCRVRVRFSKTPL